MDPSTILVRAPSLVVRLGDDDAIGIEIDGERLVAPRSALAVLEAFAEPRTIGDALARLSATSAEHFVEASSTVLLFAKAGVLRPPGVRGRAKASGFVRPSIHAAMLDDRARTESFVRALRAVVKPEDVVVDIGTGTGVLATAAALAGAKHVYAVESSGIADLAARVFADNGVDDRVTLIRGRSTEITLPERATVLVTETIGNDPLDETILEIVADARARLLAPGARIIPERLELFAIPLELPEEFLARHAFTPERILAWRDAYGIDFRALLPHRLGPTQFIAVKTRTGLTFRRPSAPVLLTAFELSSNTETTLSARASFVLDEATTRLGVALGFRATLAEGIAVSTLPGEVSDGNCWRWPVWPAFDCMQNARGTRVDVALAYARGVTSIQAASST